MGGIFHYENPMMQFMRKALMLCWLNILTALCCIPILTAGATLTALHCAVKRLRQDEGHLTRSFFLDFAQNFKKSTLIWLLLLAAAVFLAADVYICTQLTSVGFQIAQIVLIAEAVFLIAVLAWLFPLLARYDNKLRHTIRNTFILTIAYLPSTILMLILYCMPLILFLLVPAAFPLVALLGFSLPVYLNFPLYHKILDQVDAMTAPEDRDSDTQA